jgi:formylglycine-generating enzyme required for sulfatase activity
LANTTVEKDYYYSGSNKANDVAWHNGIIQVPAGQAGYGTQAVKTKAANALGLYDMSGNMWEWCWNWFDYSHQYAGYTDKDPRGAASGYSSARVLRGGSCDMPANICCVSTRDYLKPFYRAYGFRIVCSLPVTQ